MDIQTEKDIVALISNKIEESLTLEYKRCGSLSDTDKEKNQISKDVSAFANSVGGIIIYGMIESDGHVSSAIDDGFDPKKVSKEWLESVIDSRISPKIEGLVITPIELAETRPGRCLYVIKVPQSIRAPHQASDFRYYKRYNFKSMPMEDYEIKDIANRRATARPLIVVDTFIMHSLIVGLSFKNVGSDVALNVRFKADKNLKLRKQDAEDIPIFSRGVKFFPPGKEFIFWYGSFPEIVKNDAKPSSFKITVSYKKINDPLTEFTDDFYIDIEDYYYTTTKTSLVEDELKNIKEEIQKLTSELSNKIGKLTSLENIASPTGLQLSVDTLRNIKHIVLQEPFEKINALYVTHSVYMEVLGIDIETAYKLEHWIRFDRQSDPVEKHDLKPELLEQFKKYFTIPEKG